MDNELVMNAATYEVVIGNTSATKFALPDDSILRGKKIVGVAIRNQSTLDGVTRVSPSGATLVSNNALAACFITLKQDSTAIIDDVPAEYFVPDYREGEFVPVQIDRFSPSTSFIRFAATGRVSLNQVVEMTFYYLDEGQ